ncbi:hypothetical protein [Cellulomonas cellasea]|uniref:Uncharacterized protein n=1 Tax=Cellulomonas cellasea TaxID=43670 RepID=A0A7W4UJS7_9CELL|nr:hypothetical protein [Cellulomonas cellasea]MBB2925461.1 hypothetical protein [Cellulomonas cellasea]
MSERDPFARSAALWLRAYPRRWRADRAREVTEVLRDLAVPGTSRVDARTAVGLVRAGWATRWREHPPAGVYVRYRMLDRAPGSPWDGWAHDDVEGPLYPVRFAATRAAGVAIALVPVGAAEHAVGRGLVDAGSVLPFLGWFVLLLMVGKAIQRAVARRRRPRPRATPEELGPFLPYVPLRLDDHPVRRPDPVPRGRVGRGRAPDAARPPGVDRRTR